MKILFPAARFVTPEFAADGVVIDAEPVVVQIPVPGAAALPARVAVVVAHCD